MFESIKEYLLNDTVDRNAFHRTIFQLIVISSLTILVFLNIFQNSFVIDDTTMFTNWPDAKNMNITKLLEGSYPPNLQGKAYRPIKGVITAIDYKLWGSNPIGYHTQAIVLNLAITLIIFLIIKAITQKSSIAFVASLFFGIHPVHTEAITFMTASVDTWGILFFFLSFYFYIKTSKKREYYSLLSLIFAFLAFFTYELTLTLPFILILYDIYFKKINRQSINQKLIIYVGYIFLFIVFLALRLYFIGHLQGAEYFAGNFYLTMLTMTKAVVKYLELFIFPVNLSINPVLSGGIQSNITNFTNLDPIKAQRIFSFDVLSSILIIASLIGIGIISIRKKPIISFSIFFIFIALLPVLNIIPQQLVMAERYGYISSFGAVLLIGFIFNFLYNFQYKKNVTKEIVQKFLITLLIVFIIFFSFLTVKRNTDWKNGLSLWTALANQPVKGAIKNSYMGMLYFQQGKYDKATENFKQVIDKKGDIKFANYFLTFISLNTSISQGNKETAEKAYKKLYEMSLPQDRSSLEGLKKIIDNLPPASNPNMQINDSEIKHYNSQNVSFTYPPSLILSNSGNIIKIQNSQNNFFMQMVFSNLPEGVFANEYINNQKQTFGKLVNQGLAEIPTVEYAFVRIWNDNNTQKMQFFLFKESKVSEVLIYPFNDSNMKTFDKIIGSLEF